MNSNIHIIHINNVANVGSNIVNALRRLGYSAELFPLNTMFKDKNKKCPSWILVPFNKFEEIWRFRKFIRRHSNAILHVHYGTFAYLPLIFRRKFYLHIHGTDIRKHVSSPILGSVIRLGLKKAEKVFYSTPDLERLIHPYRQDAVFLPNPIDLEMIENLSRQDESKGIFIVSKLDDFKGYETVIAALASLFEEGFEYPVKMLDFGNQANRFLPMINAMNGGSIELLGRMHHLNFLEEIARSRCVVGQLSTGALGVTELEALALGVPLICRFDYPNSFKTIPPIINVNDEVSLVSAIKRIMSSNITDEYRREAMEWVKNNVDLMVVTKKLLAYYNEFAE
ncbi:MAG TPA: glycosyltransferase [Bellilinea sp.]|nr:glycosyltransferase [Bellilinea sp.]